MSGFLLATKRVVSVSVIRPIGIESRMDGRISASKTGLNWMTVEYSDAAADTDARKMKDALKRSVCDEEGRLLDGCTCETVVLNGTEFVKVSSPRNVSPLQGRNGLRRGVLLTDIIRIILYGA